jgi:starch synthase (maltosyl-transferring)
LVLAATLAPVYGIYSGFELCENKALPGREEYADSEKYQAKPRDWNAPGHIKPLVSRMNALRRDHPALLRLDNLAFLPADNENVLFYMKTPEDPSDSILIVVNLDPHNPQSAWVQVPLEDLGLPLQGFYQVEDLLDGAVYNWDGRANYVRLDPAVRPAHILRIKKS